VKENLAAACQALPRTTPYRQSLTVSGRSRFELESASLLMIWSFKGHPPSSRIGDEAVRHVNAANRDVPAILLKVPCEVPVVNDGTEGSP